MTVAGALSRALSVAFVVPYGEPSDGFFPDTLLAELCAVARGEGHRAEVVRVYYDGRDAARDAEVARRLEAWLAARDADVVVLERLFDPSPIEAHLAAKPGRTSLLVTRGDSFDPAPGIHYVVGAHPGATRAGTTRRSPTVAELSLAFRRFVTRVAEARDPRDVAGVCAIADGELQLGAPLEPAGPGGPYQAVVEQDVIALDAPPRVIRKTLFGNAGCPFADDPVDNPHFAQIRLPGDLPLARLGCAFCAMGGDYQKRPDAEVVASLVEQAALWTSQLPDVEELVLSDQYAVRYLGALLRAARAAGIRPVRWLFAARVDAFVRERARVLDAVAAAQQTGHAVEVYLSGFEAFCDAELSRYNKGTTVADQLAAIETMRELARSYPDAFSYSRARGHSLILWSPWTRPEDVAESVETMRANGARELFHEVGRNRLRLYRDIPIYYAAERDRALAPTWEGDDEGAARRKGYSVEQPWRFLDARTRLAYELARALRDALRPETEMSQLAAAVAFARNVHPDVDVDRVVADVMRDVAALERALLELAGPDAGVRRASSVRAAPVKFTGACNNACESCANRDSWLDDTPEAVVARVAAARAGGLPVALAGREPTLHPAFLDAVRAARGDDARDVGVVTNGRRFAYRSFTRAAWAAGLRAASVKVFAPSAAIADTVARDDGAHEQTLRGIRELQRAGMPAVELRVPLHRAHLESIEAFVDLARAAGVPRIYLECALDAVGLDTARAAADAVGRLARACARKDVALDAIPLTAGTLAFDRLPAR